MAPITKPETPGAGVVPGDHVTAEASSAAGVMRFEVPCSPRPAVRGMPATTPVQLVRGRMRWPEIQTHQATMAAMRRSERMSVGGLVTAASQRVGRREGAHDVSGAVWAEWLRASEARAERARGMRAVAKHATTVEDATRQISAFRATCTS